MNIVNSESINEVSNAIYICNHRCAIDIPICYMVLKRKFPRLLIKHEYKNTKTGALLSYMGAVFVNRNSRISGKQAQNVLIRSVINGGNILISPEGTRNRTDKTLLPFRRGAVYISQVTNTPIIPLAIQKSEKLKYKITIGEPFFVENTDDLEKKNNELRDKVKDMLIK